MTRRQACRIHDAAHDQRARALTAAAYANPATACWYCGLTLDAHPLGANGKPQRWQAGHTIELDCTTCGRTHGAYDSPLAPVASRCNIAAGNRVRDGLPNKVTTKW